MFVGVDLAGGEFDEDAPQRIAELALEQELAVVQPGDHHHRAGMGDPFANGLVPVRQAHRVAPTCSSLPSKTGSLLTVCSISSESSIWGRADD
jgi:hypothetical protein